ncbi:VIR protein [Plasmodium vivax]|uniref:VIR protein n=1 Tax=Plasmodium vivax TaxID=5855 RepID=A0A1G4E135_PLAVI|nr:VIR protein [Plasmodium vivax]
MATAAKAITSEDEELWDKILGQSPSYNIYQKFNSDVKENNFVTCCSMFNKTENGNNSDSYKLCRKIARNADYLFENMNTIEYSNLCFHYRPWLYQNLKKIIENPTNKETKQSIATKFLDAKNCIMYTYRVYNCLFDLNIDDLDNLKEKLEEKYLYDYFSNYNSIKTYETCDHVKLDKYKKYLNDIFTLYEKHKKEYECCDGSWSRDCFNYFKCDDNLNPQKLLIKLKNEANRSCNKLEKKNKPSASNTAVSPQKVEPDIMSTFYTGPCKNIGEDRLICSLRQASNKFPKIPLQHSKYMNNLEYKSINIKFPSYSKPSNNTTYDVNNGNKSKSVSVGSRVFNSDIENMVKTPYVLKQQTQKVTPESSKKEKKPLQTVEVQEGFKWKIGQGNISCSPNNSKVDKYNLCGYVQMLKETQKSIKDLNIEDILLENNMLSTKEHIINSSQSENRHSGDSYISIDTDDITLMSRDMYAANHPLPEEHILNSNYVRIAMDFVYEELFPKKKILGVMSQVKFYIQNQQKFHQREIGKAPIGDIL